MKKASREEYNDYIMELKVNPLYTPAQLEGFARVLESYAKMYEAFKGRDIAGAFFLDRPVKALDESFLEFLKGINRHILTSNEKGPA